MVSIGVISFLFKTHLTDQNRFLILRANKIFYNKVFIEIRQMIMIVKYIFLKTFFKTLNISTDYSFISNKNKISIWTICVDLHKYVLLIPFSF